MTPIEIIEGCFTALFGDSSLAYLFLLMMISLFVPPNAYFVTSKAFLKGLLVKWGMVTAKRSLLKVVAKSYCCWGSGCCSKSRVLDYPPPALDLAKSGSDDRLRSFPPTKMGEPSVLIDWLFSLSSMGSSMISGYDTFLMLRGSPNLSGWCLILSFPNNTDLAFCDSLWTYSMLLCL